MNTRSVGAALKRHVDEAEEPEPAVQPLHSAVRDDDDKEPSPPRTLPDPAPQAPLHDSGLPEGLTTLREVADYLESRVSEEPSQIDEVMGEVDADWDAAKLLRESTPQVRSTGPQVAAKALGRMRPGS
jgi:hypothetical protein